MKRYAITCLLCFTVFTAFMNPPKVLVDHRDQHVGAYFCNVILSTRNGYNSDTTSVLITKDGIDSVLQIKIGGNILKVKLLNKRFKTFGAGPSCSGHFFTSDSLKFHYKPSIGATYEYLGKKK